MGVEHHDVELSVVANHVAHVREDVRLHKVRFDRVELRVTTCDLQRLLVEIDAGDFGRVAESLRGDRKPAGVAAQIEHALAGGEVREAAAIVTLITEEAGLVSAEELDTKFRAELLHNDGARQIR